MATRHNLCINPAADNNIAGYGGGSTPTRTALTGFIRAWGARWTAGTFMLTPAGTATAGQQYTGSAYLQVDNFNVTGGTVYLEWLNAASGSISFSPLGFTLTAATIGRISITATAPAGTAFVRVVVDGINASVNPLNMTAVLIEQVAGLDTYFDGNSGSASWDGPAGNSSSTLTDTSVVSVTAHGPLLLGGAGVARKRTPALGRSALAVAGAAAARKALPATGLGALAFGGHAALRSVVAVTAIGSLGLTGWAGLRKSGKASGTAPLGLTGTSAPRKRASTTATSYVLLTGFRTGVPTRVVTAMGTLAFGGQAASVKVARATSSASLTISGTVAGRHIGVAGGRSTVMLAGTGTSRRVAAASGHGMLLLAAVRAASQAVSAPPARLTSSPASVLGLTAGSSPAATMRAAAGPLMRFHGGVA